MSAGNIIVATITLARNEQQETELKEALKALAALNLPVIIADGGSLKSFVDFLSNIPHFTVLHKKNGGLLAQVKDSLNAAYTTGCPFVFYTEPDKKEFFQKGLPMLLQEANPSADTGVIIASRSTKGLKSFPSFQQMTETAINRCCSELIGQTADYCYGPFLMNRNMIPYLLSISENIGWGWRPAAFKLAARMGLSVAIKTGDFFCPMQQREENADERLHRMRQLEQNIRGLLYASTLSFD